MVFAKIRVLCGQVMGRPACGKFSHLLIPRFSVLNNFRSSLACGLPLLLVTLIINTNAYC